MILQSDLLEHILLLLLSYVENIFFGNITPKLIDIENYIDFHFNHYVTTDLFLPLCDDSNNGNMLLKHPLSSGR